MSAKLLTLRQKLQEDLGSRIGALSLERGELTLELVAADYLEVMQFLRDDPGFSFDLLVDLCGVDYSELTHREDCASRFAVVVHLLSLVHNWRLRVRVSLDDSNELPLLESVRAIWNSADWYEREAFDLLGIVFTGHPDLRRILTDYDFSGHPLRKDFPLSGHVEMRYQPEEARLVYEPVSIAPRLNVPRVVREAVYGEQSSD